MASTSRCQWCLNSLFMMDNLEDFLSSQKKWIQDKQSKHSKTSWFFQAYQDLEDCFECVVTYHSAVEEAINATSSLREEIHQCNVARLKGSLSLNISANHDFDYFVSMGCTPLKEILKYPNLMSNKELFDLLNQYLGKMLENGVGTELLEQLDQDNGTFPGLYLQLINPTGEVRRWALEVVKSLHSHNPINCIMYEELEETIDQMFGIAEQELSQHGSPSLPCHLYDCDSPKVYWLGICMLIKSMDESCIQSRLLSSTSNHRQLLDIVIDVLEQSSRSTPSRDSTNGSEFWPALEILTVLLKNHKQYFWQTTQKQPDSICKMILGNQELINWLQCLAEQDLVTADIDNQACPLSNSQFVYSTDMACEEDAYNGDDCQPSSSSNSTDTTENFSYEAFVLSWIIPFVSSIISYGPDISETVLKRLLSALSSMFVISIKTRPIVKSSHLILNPLVFKESNNIPNITRKLSDCTLDTMAQIIAILFEKEFFDLLLKEKAKWLPLFTKILLPTRSTAMRLPDCAGVQSIRKAMLSIINSSVGKELSNYSKLVAVFSDSASTLSSIGISKAETWNAIITIIKECERGQDISGPFYCRSTSTGEQPRRQVSSLAIKQEKEDTNVEPPLENLVSEAIEVKSEDIEVKPKKLSLRLKKKKMLRASDSSSNNTSIPDSTCSLYGSTQNCLKQKNTCLLGTVIKKEESVRVLEVDDMESKINKERSRDVNDASMDLETVDEDENVFELDLDSAADEEDSNTDSTRSVTNHSINLLSESSEDELPSFHNILKNPTLLKASVSTVQESSNRKRKMEKPMRIDPDVIEILSSDDDDDEVFPSFCSPLKKHRCTSSPSDSTRSDGMPDPVQLKPSSTSSNDSIQMLDNKSLFQPMPSTSTSTSTSNELVQPSTNGSSLIQPLVPHLLSPSLTTNNLPSLVSRFSSYVHPLSSRSDVNNPLVSSPQLISPSSSTSTRLPSVSSHASQLVPSSTGNTSKCISMVKSSQCTEWFSADKVTHSSTDILSKFIQHEHHSNDRDTSGLMEMNDTKSDEYSNTVEFTEHDPDSLLYDKSFKLPSCASNGREIVTQPMLKPKPVNLTLEKLTRVDIEQMKDRFMNDQTHVISPHSKYSKECEEFKEKLEAIQVEKLIVSINVSPIRTSYGNLKYVVKSLNKMEITQDTDTCKNKRGSVIVNSSDSDMELDSDSELPHVVQQCQATPTGVNSTFNSSAKVPITSSNIPHWTMPTETNLISNSVTDVSPLTSPTLVSPIPIPLLVTSKAPCVPPLTTPTEAISNLPVNVPPLTTPIGVSPIPIPYLVTTIAQNVPPPVITCTNVESISHPATMRGPFSSIPTNVNPIPVATPTNPIPVATPNNPIPVATPTNHIPVTTPTIPICWDVPLVHTSSDPRLSKRNCGIIQRPRFSRSRMDSLVDSSDKTTLPTLKGVSFAPPTRSTGLETHPSPNIVRVSSSTAIQHQSVTPAPRRHTSTSTNNTCTSKQPVNIVLDSEKYVRSQFIDKVLKWPLKLFMKSSDQCIDLVDPVPAKLSYKDYEYRDTYSKLSLIELQQEIMDNLVSPFYTDATLTIDGPQLERNPSEKMCLLKCTSDVSTKLLSVFIGAEHLVKIDFTPPKSTTIHHKFGIVHHSRVLNRYENGRHKVYMKVRFTWIPIEKITQVKITLILNLTIYNRRWMSLYRICASNPCNRLLNSILNPGVATGVSVSPTLNSLEHKDCHMPNSVDVVNESQRSVINDVVKFVNESLTPTRILLVKGAPGTGKTHTVGSIIQHIIKSIPVSKRRRSSSSTEQLSSSRQTMSMGYKSRILVCCPSQSGVDTIFTRLVSFNDVKGTENWRKCNNLPDDANWFSNQCDGIKVIRLGGDVKKMDTDMKRLTWDSLANQNMNQLYPDMKNLNTELDSLQKKLQKIEINIQNKEKSQYTTKENIRPTLTSVVTELAKEIDSLKDEKRQMEKRMKELQSSKLKYNKLRNKIYQGIVLEADVVCCSLHTSGREELQKIFRNPSHFSCVIIDEASYCCELDALLPLSFGSSKLIMIGDPIDCYYSNVKSELANKYGYGKSLFTRMLQSLEKDKELPSLLIQYRMKPSLCEFPSQYFYSGRLITPPTPEQSKDSEKIISSKVVPLHAFDVENSKIELELLLKLVEFLIGNCISQHQIGIIASERTQITSLLETRYNICKKIEVGNVDLFQGRERNVMIILPCIKTSKTNPTQPQLFITGQQINIALTRCQEALYVIGQLTMLQELNKDWKEFINFTRDQKCYSKCSNMADIANALQQNVLCDKNTSLSSLTPPITSPTLTTPVLSLTPAITSSTNNRITCTSKSKPPSLTRINIVESIPAPPIASSTLPITSSTPPIASSTPPTTSWISPNLKSNPTTTITSNSNTIPPPIRITHISSINTQTLDSTGSGQAAIISSTCSNSLTNIQLQKTTNKPVTRVPEITSGNIPNSQSLNITTTVTGTPTITLTTMSSNDVSFNSQHVTGMDHEAVVHWPDSQSIAPVQSVNDVIDYSRNFPSPGVNSTLLGYGGQRRRRAYASTNEALMYRDPAIARAFRDTRRPRQT